MPFLTLNGVTIPTAKGGEIKITEYGERTAGFDGSAQIDVRSRKREWQFNTKPISMVRSRAIEGLVQGNGLYLPFDFYGGSNTSYYASNGLYPTTQAGGTPVYAQAYDGFTSLDENGARGALLGTSSLSCDPASTNVAAAATATCSATTGWTATNMSIAVDTTHFWDGANCILATPSTLTAVLQSPTTSATALSTYIVSCYIYSAAANVFLIGGNFGGSYNFVTTANHPGGCWKRFTASVIVPNGSTAIGLAVQLRAASGSVANPFWVDAVQVETQTVNGSPTAWKVGATTTPALNLEYPFNYYNPTGFTFSCWYAGNYQGNSAAELFSVFDSNGNRPIYGECFSSAAFNLNTNTSNGSGLLQTFIPNNQSAWTHLVATYYGNPYTNSLGTTFPNLNIYLNGVLSVSSVVTGVMNTPVKVDVGCAFGGYNFLGRLDDVQVLPYGVDAKWVSQTYAASSGAAVGAYGQTGLAPFLTAAGDGIDGAPVSVHGSIKQANYVGFQDPQFGWIPQGRSLQILLTEV